MSLRHWKLACTSVFLFSPAVRVSLDKRHNLFHFFPVPCLLLSSSFCKKDDSKAAQFIVTDLFTHTLYHMSPSKKKKKQKRLSDWWAALPLFLWLFCVHLGPQKVLVVGVPQASAEEQPLWTLKVRLSVFIGIRLLLHFFNFFEWKTVIVIWQCILSLMYAIPWLGKNWGWVYYQHRLDSKGHLKKKNSIHYSVGTFLSINFSCIKNNFVIVSQIESESSYVKESSLFNKGPFCFLLEPLTYRVIVI